MLHSRKQNGADLAPPPHPEGPLTHRQEATQPHPGIPRAQPEAGARPYRHNMHCLRSAPMQETPPWLERASQQQIARLGPPRRGALPLSGPQAAAPPSRGCQCPLLQTRHGQSTEQPSSGRPHAWDHPSEFVLIASQPGSGLERGPVLTYSICACLWLPRP